MSSHEERGYFGVPPIKEAPFDLEYIPPYFWVGGIAAGSWLAAAAEDLAGSGDRRLIRAGRYTALASVLAGSGLLVVDLGRPERFLNMLRIFQARSAMSIGSWALTAFGTLAGVAALLQAAEDGHLPGGRALARHSGGAAGRVLHLLGLPAALLVGGYTGVLLSATSTPAWAERRRSLPALFAASAASTGLAAVSAAVELRGSGPGLRRKLAVAQALSLSAEAILHLLDDARAHSLPSGRRRPPAAALSRRLTFGGGMLAPLALSLFAAGAPHGRGGRRASLLAAGLTLAGGLALRFLTLEEGSRSARAPEDVWAYAGGDVPSKPRNR